jgi:hypothetical protein
VRGRGRFGRSRSVECAWFGRVIRAVLGRAGFAVSICGYSGVEMALRLCEEPYHVLDLLFVPLLLLCHLRLCVAERIRLVCHHGEDHELEGGC